MNFYLYFRQIRTLASPSVMPKAFGIGVRCFRCNYFEFFDVNEYCNNETVRAHLKEDWTTYLAGNNEFLPKSLCKACTPAILSPSQESIATHKQAYFLAVAEEERRLNCLLN